MSETSFQWDFGGVLGQSSGWLVLAIVAVVGGWMTIASYRGALQRLAPKHRYALTALRVAFLLLLLFCLAGPTVVRQNSDSVDGRRAAAILVDRSLSMQSADNRGKTRLDAALKLWQANEQALLGEGPRKFFRFSTELEAASDLDAALKARDRGENTHLIQALKSVVEINQGDAISEVFCLTDGNDTSSDASEEALIDAALKSGVSLSFLAGTNRLSAKGVIGLRELRVPSEIMRKTQFAVAGIVDVSSAEDGNLLCEALVGDKVVGQVEIPVLAGRQTLPWKIPLTSGEPGFMQVKVRATKGTLAANAGAGVRVIDKAKTRVFVYQGKPNWGIRFLIRALRSDPNFEVATLVNLPRARLQSGIGDEAPMSEFPRSAERLATFGVVVLSNVYPSDLDPEQQRALTDYVKNGGGVFFGGMDAEAGLRFSGSQIEKMLPVVFERPSRTARDPVVEDFQARMKSLGGSKPAVETEFADHVMGTNRVEPLFPIGFPTGPIPAEAKALLGTESGSMPQYVSNAPIRDVKPGSMVLGIRPGALDRSGKPIPLMIQQRFGDGHSTVLTTDLLWRWQMSLPSDSNVGKRFWQQLISGLAKPRSAGLQFVTAPWSTPVGKTAEFLLRDSEAGVPVVVLSDATGRSIPLQPQPAGPNEWSVKWAAPEAGFWLVTATNQKSQQAVVSLEVNPLGASAELSNIEPDLERMRRLASATGGRVIEPDSPRARPRMIASGAETIRKEKHPLWDAWPMLLGMLGLYSAELIWRRKQRML